ncbi:DUF1016 N-terminal domain-containing protein [uncultured Chryseobacterium sp.]|uniref:DUF1016 N-terminal domain-containing protein n=1 Tax=uncultured Chryseobacterium sp. TaxID=259322 RepID=UPI0026002214|nr:DUF1016 N-terminal domain-containing protein [uncultured Chryseobacterium sp.]
MMEISEDLLFQSVKEIIIQSREKIFRVANSTLLLTYWQIGKLIVEDEQKVKERAEYGKYTLRNLSRKLTLEFGKGFDESKLRNMRAFYQVFPIGDALRHELSWTHYRLLIRLGSQDKSQLLHQRIHPEPLKLGKFNSVSKSLNLYKILKRLSIRTASASNRIRMTIQLLIKNSIIPL